MTDAEQLLSEAEELHRLRKEQEALREALGDAALVSWVSGHGPMPQKLTAFQAASVRRLRNLDGRVRELEANQRALTQDVLSSLAGGEGDHEDPEVLLRASLVVLNRLHKLGHSLPESRVVLKALLEYLRSLADP